LEFVDCRSKLGGLGLDAVGIERLGCSVAFDVVKANLACISVVKNRVVDLRERVTVVDSVQFELQADRKLRGLEGSGFELVTQPVGLRFDSSIERLGCLRIEHAPDRRGHRVHTVWYFLRCDSVSYASRSVAETN